MSRAVAWKDLRVLWASPIPYVVGALFHLLLAILFIDQLRARQQALSQPLFPLAGFLLLVLVPLLCMRTLAEEARTGSLDLLLAVPVPARPLVIGKWMAAFVTTLAVLTPALLYVVLLAWFGDPDPGPVLAGFFGMVLLSAALTGFGVLASAMTSSLPVAAIVSFFASLLLWFAHAGNQSGAGGGLLSALSLSERLRSFAAGAVDTSDIGFFVLLTVGALTLAMAAVDGRRLR
jgi:ABC-2 type transport system permease protein